VFWIALLPFLSFLGRITLIAAASSEVLMCAAYFSIISTLVRQFLAIW
jgi:hypothetical protein